MEAHHPHSHQSLGVALAATAALLVVKALGALFSHSLALAGDAAHSLGDTGALALALFADRQKFRPPTRQLSFGWGRVEILVALVNALVLWMMAGGLTVEAVRQWQHPGHVNSHIMLGVAVLSLVVNVALLRSVPRHEDMNHRATWWHLVSDVSSSLSVLLASLILLFTGWGPVNALAALVIAALIVLGAWGIIRDAIHILLEATPPEIDVDRLIGEIESVPGVEHVHDLHLWTIGSRQWALACHVSLGEAAGTPQAVLCTLHDIMASYGVHHTTIQLETADEGHPEPSW
ncbi:MAG: cation diffusion facilitator family transporter [Firmicutes bacterium]|nr:cation diffusion facilitator family transporter [Bacillota bacterium]